ncbi:hypothetical protein [Prochlorococcus marinus]|uniref:hypothetical protein n=1 Tax=Prochlorococcus marinus TaxID=1219 RepID=UPI0022B55C9C|nr:hypothetical protein [Prochlorococcus marinus]
MDANSSLGIEWRPFHEDRVINAVQNIFNNNYLLKFGLTSWEKIDINSLGETQLYLYLVPAITYLHYIPLIKILPNMEIVQYGPFLDYLFISSVGILVAELAIFILGKEKSNSNIIISSEAFILFITAPWTYRMMLAPWSDVPYLGFMLTALLLFRYKKNKLGLISILIAGLCNFIWSFFIFSFNIIIYIFVKLNISSKQRLNEVMPPYLSKNNEGIYYKLVLLLPTLIYFTQLNLAKYSTFGIIHNGSSSLFRIGIDSYQNIHHGGFLSSLQFLGGNRLSVCLSNQDLSILMRNIASFNCIMSISGLTIISLFSIVGIFILIKSDINSRWLLLPISWSFILYIMLFQQGSAVHLQGYSFVFSFLFTIGILKCLDIISKKLAKKDSLGFIFLLPIFIGIILTSIRVSFLTGING